jgi:putative ABC transport system permease protein
MRFTERIPVAWCMLIHRKGRFLLSMLGIAFSVVIMFMEIGFFNGINDSQARLASYLDADVVMIHHKRYSLLEGDKLNRIAMQQALAFDEVIAATPLYEGNQLAINAESGMARAIAVVAFPPYTHPLKLAGLEQFDSLLAIKGNILFDRKSRDIYGPVEVGTTLTLGNTPHRVVGLVEMGPSIQYDGYVFMGSQTWNESKAEADLLTMALLTVAPGTDIAALKSKLAAKFADEIDLFTPEELRHREVVFTAQATPAGGVFAVGLVIGFIIGLIICYQILFNEISDNMPQYATVKAVGFPRGYLVRLVLQQAVLLACFGFIPGLAGGYLLYHVIESSTQILMIISVERVVLVFALTFIMCVLSGLLAVQKVLRTDPAEVF